MIRSCLFGRSFPTAAALHAHWVWKNEKTLQQCRSNLTCWVSKTIDIHHRLVVYDKDISFQRLKNLKMWNKLICRLHASTRPDCCKCFCDCHFANGSPRTLRCLQINLQRSEDAARTLRTKLRETEVDVVLIQEPSLSELERWHLTLPGYQSFHHLSAKENGYGALVLVHGKWSGRDVGYISNYATGVRIDVHSKLFSATY